MFEIDVNEMSEKVNLVFFSKKESEIKKDLVKDNWNHTVVSIARMQIKKKQ